MGSTLDLAASMTPRVVVGRIGRLGLEGNGDGNQFGNA